MKHNTYAVFFLLLFSNKLVFPAYYVDPVNGIDANSGSFNSPVKTMEKALTFLRGGDTLLLFNGYYGDFGYGRSDLGDGRTGVLKYPWRWRPIAEVFTDWVTIKAVEGEKPNFGTVSLGTLSDDSGKNIPFSRQGNSNLRMRFENLSINNGVSIRGSRYIEIRNNVINLQGDTISIMGKAGIFVHNGQYITLENNDISHAGIGIQGMTRDFIIRGNNIHHNSHDGISIQGGENWLVEHNKIHDLDDGANDDEQKSGAKKWNMHVDGIHMYMVNNGDPKYPENAVNFTFRSNFFYHIEAMGVMINGNNTGGEYRDFTWENNIWGPVGGILFHLGEKFEGKMIFRNNTVLYAPGDIWTSIFGRTMNGQKYSFSLWGIDTNNTAISYEFYNNVFVNKFTIPKSYTIVGNNIYFCNDTSVLDRNQFCVNKLPYDTIPGDISSYLINGGIAGNLHVGSRAVNTGLTLTPLRDDFYGNIRDTKIDIGAVEFTGNSAARGIQNECKLKTSSPRYHMFDLLGRHYPESIFKLNHTSNITTKYDLHSGYKQQKIITIK